MGLLVAGRRPFRIRPSAFPSIISNSLGPGSCFPGLTLCALIIDAEPDLVLLAFGAAGLSPARDADTDTACREHGLSPDVDRDSLCELPHRANADRRSHAPRLVARQAEVD